MQRKVALFINGTRGEFVLRGLKKNGIFIDNIFSQKDIKKDHKEIKKKTTLNDNYIFIFVGINQIISKSLLKTQDQDVLTVMLANYLNIGALR